MQAAITLAKEARDNDEVPVGAVVVVEDEIVGRGANQPITQHDPAAHAEIVALREAGQQVGNHRLVNATLYVTIEPCMMCAGALVHARIAHLVFGALEPKAGCVVSHPLLDEAWLNHRMQVTQGVCADECKHLMQDFFAHRRQARQASK